MALGINDAFPTASFLHAKTPADISETQLDGYLTVVLVDSVINSGNTILEFLECIHAMHATLRVIVIAGVVQKAFASRLTNGGPEERRKLKDKYGRIEIFGLRVSENRYVGIGVTDTGNRLFNTTSFD